MQPLQTYDVSPTRGFVPDPDPPVGVDAALEAQDAVARELPGLIRMRRVRAAIRALPAPEIDHLDHRAAERAFLTLTVLTNAWVWGDDTPDLHLPATLARPVRALGDRLGRQAIVTHASMSLWNWRRVDPDLPPSADNAELLLRFAGGIDDTWFFTAALGVELTGGPLVALLHEAVTADTDDRFVAALSALADGADALPHALERTREWCDPDIFYRRTRPFLAGWPAPGLIYDGVSDAPEIMAGGSAGQSALIQSFDAALGIEHRGTTRDFLRDMRRYMPRDHRRFVEDLERHSEIRARAVRTGQTEAYDTVIAAIDRFRHGHMALAMDYVVKPSGSRATVGTGGTDFVPVLREARRATTAAAQGTGGDGPPPA